MKVAGTEALTYTSVAMTTVLKPILLIVKQVH